MVKTLTLTIGKNNKKLEIKLHNEILAQVDEFVHLGGLMTDDGECSKRHIGPASRITGKLSKILNSEHITRNTCTSRVSLCI